MPVVSITENAKPKPSETNGAINQRGCLSTNGLIHPVVGKGKNNMIKINSILIVAIFLFVGCSKEFKENFSQLKPLRETIIKEYGEKNIRVALQNGNCIGVSYINSRFNNESDKSQDVVRRKTLELISSTFSENKNIKMAWISFVVHKKYFFLFNYTNSLNTKFYEKSTDGTWISK